MVRSRDLMAADKIFALRLSDEDFKLLDELHKKFKLATKTTIARAAMRIGMAALKERGIDAVDEIAAAQIRPATPATEKPPPRRRK